MLKDYIKFSFRQFTKTLQHFFTYLGQRDILETCIAVLFEHLKELNQF